MERLLYKELIQWKISENRKPLVLNGARQVGKTWLLTEFGRREYAKNVLFSLDRNKDARKVFQQGGSARQLIQRLSALSGIALTLSVKNVCCKYKTFFFSGKILFYKREFLKNIL